MNDSLDKPPGMCQNVVMECLMIQSATHPRVFFRNERARFWADNTVRHNESATQSVAKRASDNSTNFLIIHPEEDPDDVPFDYEGQVIRFKPESNDGHRLSIAN